MQAELWETFAFIQEGGAVSIGVAAALAIMSVGSWTIIVVKAIQGRKLRRSSSKFLDRFWKKLRAISLKCEEDSMQRTVHHLPGNCESANLGILEQIRASLKDPGNPGAGTADSPFARIATQGIRAACHADCCTKRGIRGAVRSDELIVSALRRGIEQEAVRLETGLTLLASIGSLSPFIGLFGTVCGIYHALGSIAASGQTTIDKVAAPVGEALIMTAFGLAVAIPAVLAYNSLLRDNRVFMLLIENFAEDLYSFLTTEMPTISLDPADQVSAEKCAVLS